MSRKKKKGGEQPRPFVAPEIYRREVMNETVRVVTIMSHRYAGRWYRAGEFLNVSKADAADLIALHFATLAPAEPEPDKRRYYRRDMEAEE